MWKLCWKNFKLLEILINFSLWYFVSIWFPMSIIEPRFTHYKAKRVVFRNAKNPPFFFYSIQDEVLLCVNSTSLNIKLLDLQHHQQQWYPYNGMNSNIGFSGVFSFLFYLCCCFGDNRCPIAHLLCDTFSILFLLGINILWSKHTRATTHFFRIKEWLGYKFIIIHSAYE